MTWFKKQSRLIRILLLAIPGVNWVTEMVVRWSSWLKKPNLTRLAVSIGVTFFGFVFGWVDLVWMLLHDKLLLQ